MKKLALLFGLMFVVISVCMVYLIRQGVVLRTAPIAKPTVLSADLDRVGRAIAKRLFPDFQAAQYVLWSMPEGDQEAQALLSAIKKYRDLITPGGLLPFSDQLGEEQVAGCPQPCWILMPPGRAHELSSNSFIQDFLLSKNRRHLSISVLHFDRNVEVSAECDHEKRLSEKCLVPTSVAEVKRKLKSEERHFFMRKYQDRDFFIFIESKK